MSADIFEGAISLESDSYDKGYNDGVLDGERSGIAEGKHYGIQTAFQRYLSLGILQARYDLWNNINNSSTSIQDEDDSQKKLGTKVAKHLTQLKACVEDLPLTNSDQEVEHVTKSLAKGKAKAKVISSLMKDAQLVRLYDEQLNLKSLEENIEG